MAQASQLLPTLADQDQIVVGRRSIACRKLLEQGTIEASRGAVADVFDACLG
jgi:hypothetical protein